MSDMFGMTHQEFYELRDEYVVPFLATPGPGGGRRQRIIIFSIITNYLLQETASSDCRQFIGYVPQKDKGRDG